MSELDYRDEFGTGKVLKKKDGSYIDISDDNVEDKYGYPRNRTVSFYSGNGELVEKREINYYKSTPEEDAHPDWVIFQLSGFIDNKGKKEKKSFEMPHDIRRIIFH